MPIFGPRRGAARLAPELDDAGLGRVRKQLLGTSGPGLTGGRVHQVERLLAEPGTDWDRRMHRLVVLAECADRGVTDQWRRRSPKEADPLLLHAWAELLRSRRSGGVADPQAVLECCYSAADLAPDDPGPWIAALGVLRSLRRPLAEVLTVWREATARDAWNREAHLQMLGYLSPEECGSPGQVLDFVDSMRGAVPADAPTAGVELVSLVERHRRTVAGGGLEALMATGQWTRQRAATVLEEALAQWPKPGHLGHAAALADLNLLTYALIQANRLTDAGRVFPALAGVVTAWPWGLEGDPVRQFAHWLDRSQL